MRQRPAWDDHGDDEGNMVLAMLLTVVGLGLSVLLSSTVVVQVKTSGRVNNRQVSVSSAQAGLDAALGLLRAAVTGGTDSQNNPVGDVTKLPCTSTKSVAQYTDADHNYVVADRTVAGVTPAVRYSMSIDYYSVDPTGYQDKPGVIKGKRVVCDGSGGLGTVAVPGWALLRSTGILNGATRSLYATYTLGSNNENIPGGRIQVSGAGHLCLGSDTDPPVVGAYAKLINCATTARGQQTFTYLKNLNLRIQPAGLCLTASPALNAYVMFQNCAATTAFSQQWAFQSDHFVFMATANGTSSNGMCFTVEGAVAVGSRIKMGNVCNSNNSQHSYFPDPTVGAGAAGPDSDQLVNRANVGYCLDLPQDDVTGARQFGSGTPALITYPCKQSFSGVPHWNHVWILQALPKAQQVNGALYYRARITITPNDLADENDNDPKKGIKHCLSLPAAPNEYPWVVDCNAGQVTAATTWRIYGRHPNGREAYQIQDNSGNLCLQALGFTVPSTQKVSNAWPMVVARACDGSDAQKWNVPASWTAAPLKGLGEG